MSNSFETGLRKGMVRIGHFLEKAIGQAQKAKKSVELHGGIKPVLSLEARFSMEKLKQLIDLAADRLVQSSIPSLSGKVVAEMGEASLRYWKGIQSKRPKLLCGFLVGNAPQEKVTPDVLLSRGSFKTLPFEDHFFHWAVARLSTPMQGDVIGFFKELGRVLAPDGEALVVDYHPFGLFAKTGSARLRAVEATIRGLEDYYKMSRVAGLTPVEVRECFFDDTLRGHFSSAEELASFRDVKGTPLAIGLTLRKMRPTS